MKSHPEAIERQEPWSHYSAEQTRQVKDLIAWQATLSTKQGKPVSDGKFCTPASVDASAWNRLKNGKYGGSFGGSIDSVLSTLWRHYAPQKRGMMAVDHTPIVMEFVDEARQRALENMEKRVFWFVGETGLGKSTLARLLEVEKAANRIHATPAWKSGYTTILKAIARKLGCTHKEGKRRRPWRTTDELEQAIEGWINGCEVPPVLVFEEVRPLNNKSVRELLFFWLYIMNETRAVIIVLSAPKFFEAFRALGGEDADQFLRRTRVMAGSSVNEGHAREILATNWPQCPQIEESAQELAKAAAVRGEFDLLQEVTEALKEKVKGDGPTPNQVRKQIERYYQNHQFNLNRVA
jgi:type II secretory pathway predicted ATPase ExeA